MDLLDKFKNIQNNRKFSQTKIREVATAIAKLDTGGANIVVNGSYARQEASEQSDFDYVVMFPENSTGATVDTVTASVREVVAKLVKLPSKGSVFSKPIVCGELTKDIGGENDTNTRITHRLLFLTEGMPLGNRDLFDKQKEDLIQRYLQEGIKDHQLALFFLNDVIRFWRTMCVDFENKTFEQNKEWPIRNLKLVFSRKLLYFGGVLIASEAAQKTLREKRDIFRKLIDKPPLDRLIDICGVSSERALEDYDLFLGQMADGEFRKRMDALDSVSARQNEEFRAVKNRGHTFSSNLAGALLATYTVSHPIHRSLII